MVVADKINIGWHWHGDKKHIHIYFGKEHTHTNAEFKGKIVSILTIGALMGAGGVRGMLVTLSAISHNQVNFFMVLSFTMGVMVVFMIFGYFLGIVNDSLAKTQKGVKVAYAIAGMVSLIVGSSMILD